MESTLSGRTYLELFKRWKAMGYRIEIVFFKLDSPEICMKRIASRVAQGGHNVPRADVLRRFKRGWSNFEKDYCALADEHTVYDTSGDAPSMSTKKPSKKVQEITLALKRAAKEARRIAKMHGTKVWVMRDGKLVGIKP